MNQQLYTTRDFYLAGFLLSSGISLSAYERETSTANKQLMVFLFQDSNETQALINDYYSHCALVNPVTYSSALKTLKSMIHSNASTYENKTRKQSQYTKGN